MLTGDLWFVQVEGQIYGPYTTLQMKGYIDEGRILPTSLVTSNQSQPARPVSEFAAFAPQSPVPHTLPPQYENALELENPLDSVSNQSSIAFLMAEFHSGKSLMFIQALQSLGTAERIGENVWLLKTVYSAESLKRALCAALSREDRLFIVNSFTHETAWHNVGADMERRIQALWASVV